MPDAWRRMQRQKLANLLLVAARAEELPPELDGIVDAVTIHFPWGSLLAGVLDVDTGRVAAGLARITHPGSDVTAVLSVTERETRLGLPPLDTSLGPTRAARYAAHGFTLAEWRPARRRASAATRAAWGERPGGGRKRPARAHHLP